MDPTQIQSPTSPLGNFPELANMYRSSFQLPLSNANVSSQNVHDQTQLANEKAAAEAAQKSQEVMNDASKYRQVSREDGGFGFYDPTGKEISAADYASITGKNPADLLKDSTNPIDIGYRKDAKDLYDYMNLKLQSESDTAAQVKVKAIEADVLKTHGINIAQLTPEQLKQAFQAAYPTVYGGTNKGVPVGQTFIPQATNSFVDNYSFGGQGGGVK